MVHIKRVELSHFKSFGGTTKVPILPGFTVVSGPNGSGKIKYFRCATVLLGLASSKGMRADRLPDLVNNKHIGSGKAAEAIVSVTLDLTDLGDLSEVVTTVTDAKDLTLVLLHKSCRLQWEIVETVMVMETESTVMDIPQQK